MLENCLKRATKVLEMLLEEFLKCCERVLEMFSICYLKIVCIGGLFNEQFMINKCLTRSQNLLEDVLNCFHLLLKKLTAYKLFLINRAMNCSCLKRA
jgi:hypothetical protein